MERYNGFTNYETWYIHYLYFYDMIDENGDPLYDGEISITSLYEYCKEMLETQCIFTRHLAEITLKRVDWYEIVEAFQDFHKKDLN